MLLFGQQLYIWCCNAHAVYQLRLMHIPVLMHMARRIENPRSYFCSSVSELTGLLGDQWSKNWTANLEVHSSSPTRQEGFCFLPGICALGLTQKLRWRDTFVSFGGDNTLFVWGTWNMQALAFSRPLLATIVVNRSEVTKTPNIIILYQYVSLCTRSSTYLWYV